MKHDYTGQVRLPGQPTVHLDHGGAGAPDGYVLTAASALVNGGRCTDLRLTVDRGVPVHLSYRTAEGAQVSVACHHLASIATRDGYEPAGLATATRSLVRPLLEVDYTLRDAAVPVSTPMPPTRSLKSSSDAAKAAVFDALLAQMGVVPCPVVPPPSAAQAQALPPVEPIPVVTPPGSYGHALSYLSGWPSPGVVPTPAPDKVSSGADGAPPAPPGPAAVRPETFATPLAPTPGAPPPAPPPNRRGFELDLRAIDPPAD